MALDFQYDELMLERSALRNCEAGGVVWGYEFSMRYPSYRGTFLSCVEALKVSVDGKPISVADMRFSLNGKQFLASELPELNKEYWFVLDDATVTVLQDGGLAPGEHTVKAELVHKVPYSGYFGQYLTLTSVGAMRAAIS